MWKNNNDYISRHKVKKELLQGANKNEGQEAFNQKVFQGEKQTK